MRELVLRLTTTAELAGMTVAEIAEAAGNEQYARTMMAFEDPDYARAEGDRERDRVLAALQAGELKVVGGGYSI